MVCTHKVLRHPKQRSNLQATLLGSYTSSSASTSSLPLLSAIMNLFTSCALLALADAADAFSSLRMSSTDLPPPLRVQAASPPPKSALHFSAAAVAAAPIESGSRARVAPREKPLTLGLLTFDLDDSLYPINQVLKDANDVFVTTMAQYGYSIEPEDIVEAGKLVREEAGPVAGAAMTHTTVCWMFVLQPRACYLFLCNLTRIAINDYPNRCGWRPSDAKWRSVRVDQLVRLT